MLGPAVLYAALVRVLVRLAGRGPLVVVIDDAHLAGQALANWLSFARRANMPAAVVAAVRSGEGPPLPATASVHLGLLGREAAAELVGPSRADELYERSKGHPLFLTELAQQAARAELPTSLVESVSARCDELGPAGAMLRAAAVIGPELDIELLAALLGRPAVDLLDDAERAAAKQLLTTDGGTFRFRHELVREALAASATAGRAALLHRQAGRVLARQPYADPAMVAYHARLGGDLELAARSLRTAAERAAERFDHAAAEALLDDALRLHPDPEGWLERARVRTRRRRYAEALADVELAAAAGAAALEVGAWACYFDRRFAQAAQFAADGALAAADPAIRSRCLAVGGRTRHAAGDLAQAELLLGEAFALAEGTDRVTAAAWLGVLRAHQAKTEEALALLRPAARAREGVAHTAATLHSLLFTGHAHAAAGRPALALDAFTRYTAEVERRQVPRFAGRAVNFAGWVLRSLGAADEADDHHRRALELGQSQGTVEVTIAALEDLAEQCVEAGDAGGAQDRLAQARTLLTGDLVFGWRLELKYQLLTARLALLRGDAEAALAAAAGLETRAAVLGVPRYVSVARVLKHRARRALSLPVDLDRVAADLDLVEGSVAVEAWWWTGEAAADFAVPAWLDVAAGRAERLARQAGDYADTLRRAAAGAWTAGEPRTRETRGGQLAASVQQRGRPDRLRLPPRELLVITAQGLLPAELDQGAQQAQRQLAVPPGFGADALLLQRPAVGGDGVLLALRQAAAVDRQVPGQVGQRRAAPGLLPVQHDRPALLVRAQVVQLPVAVHERLRGDLQRLDQRARVPGQRGDDRGRGRGDLGQPRPALAHQPRHQVRGAGGRLGARQPGGQLQVAVHDRDDVAFAAALPERGVQRGHVPQEPQVLVQADRLIAHRDQPPRHVPHQQGTSARGRPASGVLRGHPHDRLVETRGQPRQQAALPGQQRRAAQAARRPHGPVLGQVEVLEHVRLPADHHPLQPGPGFPRRPVQPGPLGRARDELGHAGMQGNGAAGRALRPVRHRPPPSPRAATPATARRT